jgi:hypothetical protein
VKQVPHPKAHQRLRVGEKKDTHAAEYTPFQPEIFRRGVGVDTTLPKAGFLFGSRVSTSAFLWS